MMTPPYLQKGDRVGLLSTARHVKEGQVQDAVQLLESWGLQAILGPSIGALDHQYAGTDALRSKDLQTMLDDPTIKAIWCAKGGYGTVRIIDRIDFSNFITKPKWIIGYSDITVLHNHLNHLGCESLHAAIAMGIEGKSAFTRKSLQNALFGKDVHYAVESHPYNRMGTSTGALVGGNLSILYSLCGSKSALNTRGKILFIEDLDEYLYHVDRMMMNLKRNGMLDHLSGLVVGGLTDMNDNEVAFGKTAQEIIKDAVAEYEYPVCFDFPAGHIEDNRALILGRKASLEVTTTGVKLNLAKV